MRLDVLVTLLPPERSLVVAPHGILGQSFDGSGIAVDGAVDPKPQPGELMTTKAMAEGSIEGAWQDYVMPSPYATFFRYSRFGLTKADRGTTRGADHAGLRRTGRRSSRVVVEIRSICGRHCGAQQDPRVRQQATRG